MDYLKEYARWINSPIFDERTKQELKKIKDENEIKDRFYKNLSFGTGGLRGLVGAGTNRINKYTVGKATQGFADYLNQTTNNPSVVIAYDSRINSFELAEFTALVLCANQVKVFLFNEIKPTPQLSFAIRELNATAGIVITASHNPKEYNGYKVYLSDGGQIVPPYDKYIIDAVNKVKDFTAVKVMDKKEAIRGGVLSFIGQEIDQKYINAIKALTLNCNELRFEKNLKIVYSPLHGTGLKPVKRLLNELGFKNLFVVEEQAEADGNFSTVKYPNPEDFDSFKLALQLAKEKNADVVFATDADADRVGVCVKDDFGNYVPLSGNVIGILIADYILLNKKQKELLPKNFNDAALVTTIVSTKMAKALAKEYGVTLIEVLTGFKYIGEQIKLFEKAKKENGEVCSKKYAYEFIFGFEESFGFLVGTYARDKDAISAIAILCEMAAHYKSQNLTLYNVLQTLYKKYGYYSESLKTITLSGIKGANKIDSIISELKTNTPKFIGEFKVLALRDYNTLFTHDFVSGNISLLTLPKSNVLYFELENDAWCCIRPSGTEPKIKIYFGVKGESQLEAERLLKNLEYYFFKMINKESV